MRRGRQTQVGMKMISARPAPLGDPEIRTLLKQRVLAQKPQASSVVLIEELGLCRHQVRVDVAVVDNILHGYEIKSDRDSLRRLAKQAMVYGEIFDRATLVVGMRYVGDALDMLPDWWEVVTVNTLCHSVRLTRRRAGRLNPSRSPRALVELLWLDDALRLIQARGGTRGYRGKPRRVLWDRVCELYTVEEIASEVRTRLRARKVPGFDRQYS